MEGTISDADYLEICTEFYDLSKEDISKQYDATLANANKAFHEKDYKTAKSLYAKLNTMIPKLLKKAEDIPPDSTSTKLLNAFTLQWYKLIPVKANKDPKTGKLATDRNFWINWIKGMRNYNTKQIDKCNELMKSAN